MKYGVTLKELSDICKLTNQTIHSFETCRGEYTQINARSYNSDMMVQTLQSIIDKKNEEANHMQKVIDKQVEKWHRGSHQVLSNVSSANFLKYLKKYCASNHFTIKEFAKMCNMSDSTFCDYYVKIHPFLTERTLNKIMKATGWNIVQISSGSFCGLPSVKETAKQDPESITPVKTHMSNEERKNYYMKKLQDLGYNVYEQESVKETRQSYSESNTFKLPPNATDVSLTVKNGTYCVQYIVPTWHKQYVSKARFMELIKEV